MGLTIGRQHTIRMNQAYAGEYRHKESDLCLCKIPELVEMLNLQSRYLNWDVEQEIIADKFQALEITMGLTEDGKVEETVDLWRVDTLPKVYTMATGPARGRGRPKKNAGREGSPQAASPKKKLKKKASPKKKRAAKPEDEEEDGTPDREGNEADEQTEHEAEEDPEHEAEEDQPEDSQVVQD